MNQITRLGAADMPLTTDPARSYTLPARFYRDPAILEAEREAIFFRSWWQVAHVCRLAEPGAYVTARIHDQHVLVMRGTDGALRAFYNVCQHRGHRLLDGEGRAPVIRCPYHAWVYGTDGALRQARNSQNVEGFDLAAFGLRPVAVETCAGFVFVNLDPTAVQLVAQAGGLEGEIRRIVPDLDAMVFARRDTYTLAANWKTVVDNFLECYHCAPAHKDFVDLVDMGSYRTIVHGIYSSQVADRPRTTTSSAYTFRPGAVDFGYAGWFLWPNLTIWAFPGDPCVATLQIIPDGPERTIEHMDWYCLPPCASPQIEKAMRYMKDVLQPEDIRLCENVQEGLRSRGYDQGRFMVDRARSEISEHAVHHFQRMVLDALER
ncbi:MAG: aromatic ring-hydroxylating dioxygenase subunit alpha [Alphaproteobacteria bacterium]|nr:aromatic ring-hydroxylating dioxygenase subunit alpha [Alphaproteobacteria bacterium]